MFCCQGRKRSWERSSSYCRRNQKYSYVVNTMLVFCDIRFSFQNDNGISIKFQFDIWYFNWSNCLSGNLFVFQCNLQIKHSLYGKSKYSQCIWPLTDMFFCIYLVYVLINPCLSKQCKTRNYTPVTMAMHQSIVRHYGLVRTTIFKLQANVNAQLGPLV